MYVPSFRTEKCGQLVCVPSIWLLETNASLYAVPVPQNGHSAFLVTQPCLTLLLWPTERPAPLSVDFSVKNTEVAISFSKSPSIVQFHKSYCLFYGIYSILEILSEGKQNTPSPRSWSTNLLGVNFKELFSKLAGNRKSFQVWVNT